MAALVKRKVFVYLCTNAVLLPRKIDKFTPSPYFSFAVHIDGLRERHDEAVDREGVFDEAVAAIRDAKARGFRVTTNSTFFNTDSPKTVRDVLDFLNDDLGVDAHDDLAGVRLREGARPGALPRRRSRPRSCSATPSPTAAARHWRLNHSPLFLDFLEGKVDFQCTAWGIPSYSVLGWQKPCYLMADGYVSSYKELLETTDWSKYGRGRDPALRQLHGPLRLRAHRGARHAQVAAARRCAPSARPDRLPPPFEHVTATCGIRMFR